MTIERIDRLGQYGLNSDVSGALLPLNAFSEFENIMTHDGSIGPAFGDQVLRALPIAPKASMIHTDLDGEVWAIISDGEKVYACNLTDDALDEEITPAWSGDWSGGRITMCTLNGVPVVNSKTEGPHYWPGSGNLLTQLPGPGDAERSWLTGSGVPGGGTGSVGDYYYDTAGNTWYEKTAVSTWTTPPPGGLEYGWNWNANERCEAMAAYRYNLVAVNLKFLSAWFPQKLRWSSSAEDGAVPTQWYALASNDAGDDLVGETGGALTGAVNLRDSLYITKTDAVYEMTWVGDNTVFAVRRLIGGIGTPIVGGYCEMRGSLVIATATDVYLFDGVTAVSLMDQRIRKAYQEAVADKTWERITVFYYDPVGLLIVGIPDNSTEGLLTEAFIFQMGDETWSHKTLSSVWGFLASPTNFAQGDPFGAGSGLAGQPWAQALRPATAGDLMTLYYNTVAAASGVLVSGISPACLAGEAVTSRARREGLPLGGGDNRRMITEVWPELRGQVVDDPVTPTEVPLIMRFGGQMTPGGDIDWDPTDYEVWPEQTHIVCPRVSGRYLAWEIESTGIGGWRMSALTLKHQPAGKR